MKVPTEVVEIVESEVTNKIRRENQVTCVELTGEIGYLDLSATQAKVIEVMDGYDLPDGYSYEFGETTEMMN